MRRRAIGSSNFPWASFFFILLPLLGVGFIFQSKDLLAQEHAAEPVAQAPANEFRSFDAVDNAFVNGVVANVPGEAPQFVSILAPPEVVYVTFVTSQPAPPDSRSIEVTEGRIAPADPLPPPPP